MRPATLAIAVIPAAPEAVWDAFMDPSALVAWLPPAPMTGRIHAFDPEIGGGYVMSLHYPPDETRFRGKTAEREDRVQVRFLALDRPCRIVEAVTFVGAGPAFQGEMRIEVTLAPVTGGTEVAFRCTGLPPGLGPEDNEAGSRISLAQLARRFG